MSSQRHILQNVYIPNPHQQKGKLKIILEPTTLFPFQSPFPAIQKRHLPLAVKINAPMFYPFFLLCKTSRSRCSPSICKGSHPESLNARNATLHNPRRSQGSKIMKTEKESAKAHATNSVLLLSCTRWMGSSSLPLSKVSVSSTRSIPVNRRSGSSRCRIRVRSCDLVFRLWR